MKSNLSQLIALTLVLTVWLTSPALSKSATSLQSNLENRLVNYAVCLVAHHKLGNKKQAKKYFDLGHEINSIASENNIQISSFDDIASMATRTYSKMSDQFLSIYIDEACHNN